MSTAKKLLWICALSLLSLWAQAALKVDWSSAQLEGVPGARLLEQRSEGNAERSYPLSALRRINNQPRAEQRLSVAGTLNSVWLQLPNGHDALQLLEALRLSLQQQGRLLYWCQKRACGASSQWANSLFARAQLTAPDDQQAFILLQNTAESEQLLALYASHKANGRSFLYLEALRSLEALSPQLPSAATLLQQLSDQSGLALPAGAPEQAWLALLLNTLKLDSLLRLELQGDQAKAWAQALEQAGANPARIKSIEGSGATVLRRQP